LQQVARPSGALLSRQNASRFAGVGQIGLVPGREARYAELRVPILGRVAQQEIAKGVGTIDLGQADFGCLVL
jgi:hypothetical protein